MSDEATLLFHRDFLGFSGGHLKGGTTTSTRSESLVSGLVCTSGQGP